MNASPEPFGMVQVLAEIMRKFGPKNLSGGERRLPDGKDEKCEQERFHGEALNVKPAETGQRAELSAPAQNLFDSGGAPNEPHQFYGEEPDL